MVLKCTHNLCSEQKYEKYKKKILLKIFIFNAEKILCILHRQVFVMATSINTVPFHQNYKHCLKYFAEMITYDRYIFNHADGLISRAVIVIKINRK